MLRYTEHLHIALSAAVVLVPRVWLTGKPSIL